MLYNKSDNKELIKAHVNGRSILQQAHVKLLARCW